MTDTQEPESVGQPHGIQDENSPRVAPTSGPDDIAPPVGSLIAAIRAAVTRGASAEVRAAGAMACRSILTVLDAKPGQPLAATTQPASLGSTTSLLGGLLSQPGLLSRVAAMSRDELINLLKQITGAMPASARTPATAGPRFHLIQIPLVRKPDGDR